MALFVAVGLNPYRNFNHRHQGFELAAIPPHDLIIKISNSLGFDRDDQRVFQLMCTTRAVPFRARVVVNIKNGSIKRTAPIIVFGVKAIFPLPSIAP